MTCSAELCFSIAGLSINLVSLTVGKPAENKQTKSKKTKKDKDDYSRLEIPKQIYDKTNPTKQMPASLSGKGVGSDCVFDSKSVHHSVSCLGDHPKITLNPKQMGISPPSQ